MKRRRMVIKLIGLLMLGAVINIAVAWGDGIIEHERDLRDLRQPVPNRSTLFKADFELSWSAGFPMDSLMRLRSNQIIGLDSWRCGWKLQFGNVSPGDTRFLPLIPIWPGFAINTLFYAAFCWGLFAVPGVRRHKRRMKRGLCTACAYPIGTSEVCTECGNPLRR